MRPALAQTLQFAGRCLALLGGLDFLFGDRVLREFYHLSFMASLVVWAGSLVVIFPLALLLGAGNGLETETNRAKKPQL